jgi:hypothetical protein
MLLTSVLRDMLRRREGERAPVLSIVVNFYNNRREALNTLHSLTRSYQRHAQDIAHEVIALDNGSSQPLADADVRAFGPEFEYRFVQTASVSPAPAINAACREAIGERLLVIVDGAHILSPGVLHLAHQAFERFPSPFAVTVPFHLGPKIQNESVPEGYNQQVEDQLLASSGWKDNGYRLYSIAGAFADDSGGWYGQLFESGCFAIRKSEFLRLGGFDEAFTSPGGGLTSLDFFQRALLTKGMDYVILLGEGTFHQVHGGVATNASLADHPWKRFHREYLRIRGHRYMRVPRKPKYLGTVPPEAAAIADFSRKVGEELWRTCPAVAE